MSDNRDRRRSVTAVEGTAFEFRIGEWPSSDLTIRNPAPDGSPPQLPSGTCRDVTITRDHKSGTI
jgi:hypothetical protein